MDGFLEQPRQEAGFQKTETEQQRIEREQVQKEYKGALIKMILAILVFTAVMFVGMMVLMTLNLGFVSLLMPVIALVIAIPFGLWFMHSPMLRNFRKAAIKNAMYSRNFRETMEDSREAMKSGPAKEYMEEFKQQMKDELREEIKGEMQQEQAGYKKPYS